MHKVWNYVYFYNIFTLQESLLNWKLCKEIIFFMFYMIFLILHTYKYFPALEQQVFIWTQPTLKKQMLKAVSEILGFLNNFIWHHYTFYEHK